MTNVVIASDDPLAQRLKSYLVRQQGFFSGPLLDPLDNGNQLWIVAHDTELGDGSAFLANRLQNAHFLMEIAFEVVLIVCSTASLDFSSKLLTPAQRIANILGRNVIASNSDVYGYWGANRFTFQGNFVTVTPNTDLMSLFDYLTFD